MTFNQRVHEVLLRMLDSKANRYLGKEELARRAIEQVQELDRQLASIESIPSKSGSPWTSIASASPLSGNSYWIVAKLPNGKILMGDSVWGSDDWESRLSSEGARDQDVYLAPFHLFDSSPAALDSFGHYHGFL